ncbi:MAG: bifunctional folylpolyglutamate synthase/dihydrofolate synthase [Solobacterium sp.]|jgi:dihydrofolate synthase/folylpolyglutamate synthase|nr:bifunctional folylpolyglutamate synthase/dihydrofolate synthase [Solobacterium sp.]MCH4205786.1 bifunctional folylpolyglutamate synthase/dihydrofolate synthase [Solobacterium sp.]MCH4227310.1 bifunctional folylpolyglutamate synthase/dihydrofolate synthase [Solobacterium sp.]
MTEYNEAWVMSRRNPNHGLAPLKRVLASIGDPQDALCTIHIAGTNGKGSVTNDLKEILKAHGYKVGMFTSPHLVSHRDRIRINDDWISEEVFQKYLDVYLDAILREDLGMFEIDCLIAFSWFKDQKVDYALIECGLGGRLDNTNVIAHPSLAIVTTVAYDHMNILGGRLQQIAFEKAGIIQKRSVCLIGHLPQNTLPVFRRKADRMQASLVQCPPFYDRGPQRFCFDQDEYEVSSFAAYQKYNAALALEGAKLLGISIHTDLTKQALYNAHWAGRFEIVSRKPLIILDGAHNEEGMHALIASMQPLPHPITAVFSALKDKPGQAMAQMLKENCDRLIITQFAGTRADSLADLMIAGCEAETSWQDAIEKAKRETAPEGSIVITGSLYFISLARKYLM